jgi:hypothetical protein
MRLGDNRFFNLFALVAAASNKDRMRDAWDVDRVHWIRERVSHGGPNWSLHIEVHTLDRAGRGGWTLLVGRETWWEGGEADAFRNGHWVHLSRGTRDDVLKWFEARERELG